MKKLYVRATGWRQTNDLPYEIYLDILENNLSNFDIATQNRLTCFGYGGLITLNVIEKPYTLNPNKYLFLVIPVFQHIDIVQNDNLAGAFAKILIPGESAKPLFNTFTSSTKIFNDSLYNNLTELEIAFVTNDGFLFDFNGAEHSFSIEITEIIDKFEYINPKFGNIEY